MKNIDVIIIGFGNIGRGFVEVLLKKREFLKNLNYNIRVKAICEHKGSLIPNNEFFSDNELREILEFAKNKNLEKHKNFSDKLAKEVLETIDADIALELTPGNIKTGEPGLSNIINALRNGKHVVTSNKSPIALKFNELMSLAKEKNKRILYEATVAGAIPLFNLYKETLQINEIKEIYGIFNGTTNYILTKMFEEGKEFDIALKEAQELGYAERDPTYDINGYDTGVKVVIVANALLKKSVNFNDVKIYGINEITQEAINLAKRHNYVIKLIGDCNKLEVSPRLIKINDTLNVGGNLNAVRINLDIAKDITIIGRGAGAIETNSSIFSDILRIGKEEL
ncbi:MAG: homoserine dehydrogenase [Candidatus Altarchaeaceae archaeon]